MTRTLLTAIFLALFSQTAWAISEERFSEALSIAKLDTAVLAIRDNCVKQIGANESSRECKCAIKYASLENKLAFEIQYNRCVKGDVSDKTEDELKAEALVAFIEGLRAIGNEQQDLTSEDDTERRLAENAERTNSSNPLTLDEIDALREQVSSCWKPVATLSDPDRPFAVDIVVTLDQQGNVITAEAERNRQDFVPRFKVAANEAIRAMFRCSPLNLPPEKYDQWKSFTFRFDPKFLRGQ